MDIQKNSFYTPTSGCPGHQGAPKFDNNHTTDSPPFNSGDIDSPPFSKKHHSCHATDSGDIDDHQGENKNYSKHTTTHTKSTQNEESSNFLTKWKGFFNKDSNSSQPETDPTKSIQNQDPSSFLTQLNGLFGNGSNSTQPQTDFTKFIQNQNQDPSSFLTQLNGLFGNGSNSSQPQTNFTKFIQNQNQDPSSFLTQLNGLFGNGSNSSQPQTDFTKFTQNQNQDPSSFLTQLNGLPNNQSNSSQPQTQPVQHTNSNEKGTSPVNNSQPSSTTQNPPSSTTPTNTNSPRSPAPGHYANNLDEAAKNTHVKFMPVVRGDEASENAKIHDQASFARAVDKTALEYGLDPNQFRAQLEKESGAMRDYKKAMQLEGDLGRRSENNTSIGIGQISRKFLDGRDWSDGGPNNERVGGKTVTTEMYNNSTITQLRVAASNLAMRIQDHGNGDLKKGLNYYVSGHTETDSHNINYTTSINEIMKNKELMNIGR